jgi:TetR/AcrR family transcriptional regulator, regulator of cefoperazone and chloramphenicol sensitivity
MPNVKNNATAQETRRKLIDAAGEVFAQRGLHAATIQQITHRAGVNIASINYHFRDKFELYAAVIRHALSSDTRCQAAENIDGTPEQRLRAHVAAMLHDLIASSQPAWHSTLISHELAQPTAALDAVMDEIIRPRSASLHNIVRDILGPDTPEDVLCRAGISVAAQCFMYVYSGEVIRRLHPGLIAPNNMDTLIDHITQFSLAALRGMRRQYKPRQRSPRQQKTRK